MRSKSLLGLILLAGIFIANSGGQNANRAGAPGDASDCGGCHEGGGAATGNIQISGLPAEYEPEQTYSMSITVNEPNAGAQLSAAGFQIVATNAITNQMVGNFTVTDAFGTRLTPSPNNRLVQSIPKAFSGSSASWNFEWTAPSTDNFPEEITFFYSGNSVDEGGSFFGDIAYFNASVTSVVPVKWNYIQAEMLDEESIINWGTETEVNNSHFEIEHSIDGIYFDVIGRVQGAGESVIPQYYDFIHEELAAGINYYRIKQVDYNGKFEYSQTTSVDSGGRNIKVYPTEVLSELKIDGAEDSDQLRIYDFTGKLSVESPAKSSIDLNHLSNGMYIVQLLDSYGGIISAHKIIKQ